MNYRAPFPEFRSPLYEDRDLATKPRRHVVQISRSSGVSYWTFGIVCTLMSIACFIVGYPYSACQSDARRTQAQDFVSAIAADEAAPLPKQP